MRQHQCAPASPRNTTVTVVGPFVSVLEVRSHPALLPGNQANLPRPQETHGRPCLRHKVEVMWQGGWNSNHLAPAAVILLASLSRNC